MKRLIQVTIVAVSIVMFLFVREAYKMKDVSDMYNHYGYRGEKVTVLEFDGNMIGFDENEFIQTIYGYCNSAEVSFVYDVIDEDKKIFHEYIASPHSLNDLYGFYGPKEELFNDPNTNITVTNNKNELNHYECFNTDWDVRYISFNQFNKAAMPPGTYLYFDIFAEDLSTGRQVANELVQKYKEYGLTILDMTQSESEYKSIVQQRLLVSLLFLIGILAVLLLFYMSDQLKNITIFKLNGYEGASVFWGLIGKELLTAMVLSVLSVVVLYVGLVGFLSPHAYEFILAVLIGMCGIFAIVLLLTLLFSVSIRFFSLSTMLKGRNANNQLSFAAYAVKFIVAMVAIPLILNHFAVLSEYWNYYSQIIKYKNMYESTYRILSYSSDYSYLNNSYRERSDETNDPQYLKEIELVDSFVEAGAYYAIPIQVSVFPDTFGCPVVNLNYFVNEYPDSEEKADIIKTVENGDTVFVISKKYEKDLETVLRNFGAPFEIDHTTVASIEFKLPYFDSEKEAEGLLVIPDDEPMYDKQIYRFYFLKGFTPEGIEEILEKNGMGGMFVYDTLLDESSLSWARQLTLEQALWIAAYSFLLVLNAYSFFITYRNANRKKTAVQTLHGYRFFQLYWDYLLEAFLIYVPVVIFYKQPVWEVIVIAVIVEIVCMIPAFIKAKKTGLVS